MSDKGASITSGMISNFSSMRMGASGRWSLLLQALRRNGWMLVIISSGLGYMTTTILSLDTTFIRGTGVKKNTHRRFFGGLSVGTNDGGADIAVVRNRLTGNVFLYQVRRNTFSPNGMASQRFRYNRLLHDVRAYTHTLERNILLDVSSECCDLLFVDPEFRSARKKRQFVYESGAPGTATDAAAAPGDAAEPSWLGRLFGAKAVADAAAPPRRAFVETAVTSEYVDNVEGDPVFPFAAVSFDISIRCLQDHSLIDGTWEDVRDTLNGAAVDVIHGRFLKAIRRRATNGGHPAIVEERIRTGGLTGRGVTFKDLVENDCDAFASEMHALVVQAAEAHHGILQALTVTVKSATGEQAVVQRTFGGPNTAAPVVLEALPVPSTPAAV